MNLIKTFLLVPALFTFIYSNGQEKSNWLNRFHSSGPTILQQTLVDSLGNTYSKGSFQTNLNVDFSGQIPELQAKGSYDYYLAKQNADGDFLWIRQFWSDGNVRIEDLCFDVDGNIIGVGGMQGNLLLNEDTLITNNSTAQEHGLLLKLNPEGIVLNSYLLESTTEMGYNNVLNATQDPSGGIFLYGIFSGTIDLDLGQGEYIIEEDSADCENHYVVKLDDNFGVMKYVKMVSKPQQGNELRIFDLKVDENSNLYGAGYFRGKVYMDSLNSKKFILNHDGKHHGQILKIANNGDAYWFKHHVSSNHQNYISELAINKKNELYTIGVFIDTLITGNEVHSSLGNYDIFIHKMNDVGDHIWTKTYGTEGNEDNANISYGTENKIYASFNFEGTFHDKEDSLISFDDPDLMLIEIDSMGDINWKHHIIGDKEKVSRDLNYQESREALIVSGSFHWTVDFDRAAPEDWRLHNTGQYVDGFIYKLTFCDLDPNVENENGILKATETNVDYQWIYCDGTPVEGETLSEFIPTDTGHYALIISRNNNCTDTSDCFLVEPASVQKTEHYNVRIYPNPTPGTVRIVGSDKINEILVYDPEGRMIQQSYPKRRAVELNLKTLATGFYFLKITGKSTVVRKIFRE